MQIAVATEFFHPHIGGTEHRIVEIFSRLAKRGHSIDVFTVRYDDRLPKEEEKDGLRIHRYAQDMGYATPNGSRSVRGVLNYALSTMIRAARKDFDVWYLGQWPMLHSLMCGGIVSQAVQEWCEVWDHDIVPLEKMMAKITSHHVAVGESVKRRLVDLLAIHPDDVVTIHSGVDPALLAASARRKEWGKIVYVGRLTPHKRLDLLLDAYRLAKAELPEIELHLAGSGPCLPMVSKKASELEDAHVYGEVSDAEKIELLRSSWLFVMPSEREGLPHAPLEAMATGTPVLTVDYPNNGTTEICKYGNGFVTKPDHKSIALSITRFFREEDEWKRMSMFAREFAQKFDWDKSADQMEQYLATLVESQSLGGFRY